MEEIMDLKVQYKLQQIHGHLMYKKFSYHSVSVIYRGQELGFHVIFMKSVKEMVTDEIKGYLKAYGFSYSFI
jgi:hypothetical protein